MTMVLLVGLCMLGHAQAQQFSLGTLVQGGATNVSGIKGSTLGGRGGVRLAYGTRTVTGTLDLCYVNWRDIVREEIGPLSTRMISKFNSLELSPSAEIPLSEHVRLAAGVYGSYLLNSKGRDRTYNAAGDLISEVTYVTTEFFDALDFGLRFRLAYEVHPGWRLEAVYSQGLLNSSVFPSNVFKTVPQGLLLGLAWSPRHATH
jgi:hypothetical protein